MSEKHDYLTSHFSDVRYDPDRQKFVSTMYDDPEDLEGETVSKKFKRGRKDLERLLLKADKNNISKWCHTPGVSRCNLVMELLWILNIT